MTAYDQPPAAPPTSAGPLLQVKDTVWPKVLGIIAIVFAAFGIIGGCMGAFAYPLTEAMYKMMPQQAAQETQLANMKQWMGWMIAMAQAQGSAPAMPVAFQQTMILFGSALGLIWGWALPVFLIIWFRRQVIKNEVATWP